MECTRKISIILHIYIIYVLFICTHTHMIQINCRKKRVRRRVLECEYVFAHANGIERWRQWKLDTSNIEKCRWCRIKRAANLTMENCWWFTFWLFRSSFVTLLFWSFPPHKFSSKDRNTISLSVLTLDFINLVCTSNVEEGENTAS